MHLGSSLWAKYPHHSNVIMLGNSCRKRNNLSWSGGPHIITCFEQMRYHDGLPRVHMNNGKAIEYPQVFSFSQQGPRFSYCFHAARLKIKARMRSFWMELISDYPSPKKKKKWLQCSHKETVCNLQIHVLHCVVYLDTSSWMNGSCMCFSSVESNMVTYALGTGKCLLLLFDNDGSTNVMSR